MKTVRQEDKAQPNGPTKRSKTEEKRAEAYDWDQNSDTELILCTIYERCKGEPARMRDALKILQAKDPLPSVDTIRQRLKTKAWSNRLAGRFFGLFALFNFLLAWAHFVEDPNEDGPDSILLSHLEPRPETFRYNGAHHFLWPRVNPDISACHRRGDSKIVIDFQWPVLPPDTLQEYFKDSFMVNNEEGTTYKFKMNSGMPLPFLLLSCTRFRNVSQFS